MTRQTLFVTTVLCFFILVSCQKESGQEPFNYANDTPSWLKDRIAIMSNDTTRLYAQTKVYRYNWHSAFVYYISIPLSSCMYCDVYDQEGNRIQFTGDAMLQDFLNTRSNEVLIWQSAT